MGNIVTGKCVLTTTTMQIVIQAVLKFNHWPYQCNKTFSQSHKSLSSNDSSYVVEYIEHTGKVILKNVEMPWEDFHWLGTEIEESNYSKKASIILALSTSSD